MTDLIGIILDASLAFNDGIIGAFSVLLRVGGAMAFLPGIGESVIPVRVKLIAALSITVLVFGQDVLPPQNTIDGLHLISDVIIGIAIGLSFRVLIFSIEICGHIISNMTSMAQVFPNGAEVSPVISTLMKYIGILLLMKLGLVERYCEALMLSYHEAGQFEGASSAELFSSILSKTTMSLDIALHLSLPFVIFSILYNFVLGLMNRIMPALMVHLIFAPAMALSGLAILFLFGVHVIIQWLQMTSWG